MDLKENQKIRNFCIIAHVDHGKSTLADRFLELTQTVDIRKMRDQYLDQLELEREKGITIKMAPVRMKYFFEGEEYLLNLIDTPGHSDFSYEVSRALFAVEGAILLVDAIQGIQAQTLANFRKAQEANLKLIGVINKIDLKPPNLEALSNEISHLIGCQKSEIYKISSKTGEGVKELLEGLIQKLPPPRNLSLENFNYPISRALIFDSFYDEHKGVVVSVRIFNGEFLENQTIKFLSCDLEGKVKEVGYFAPELKKTEKLKKGEIGYLVTGVKDPKKIKIGDTIISAPFEKIKPELIKNLSLPGFQPSKPVVFVSFYPERNEDYESLKKAFEKLQLNDSSLVFEPDNQEILGRGFKVGFLGKLHFEITAERLKREFNIETIQSFPSVIYKVKTKNEIKTIIKPEDLPSNYEIIYEQMVKIEILTPVEYLSNILSLQRKFRMKEIVTETIGDQIKIKAIMPLVELISDFDDQLKSVSQGFASFSYELSDFQPSEIVKVEFLVAGKVIPGLTRFLPREYFEEEARKMVLKLKNLLPRQQFAQAIQARANGRIIAREDIPALRKDVTGYLYGGDRTRKMKLWQKQKEGKKKLKQLAKVKLSVEIFKELLKK